MKVVVHSSVRKPLDQIAENPGGSILLHGPKSVGKSTIASDIARRINCEGCEDESCHSCLMAKASTHPDIIVIEPDEKRKIGIDAVHDLQHKLQYSIYDPKSKRVVVMHDADTLTIPAQNALLKTLEEPPVGTTVILTASSTEALLETILSRCRLVYVPPMGSELKDFLQENYPGDTDAAIEASLGMPGKAITYLTDEDTRTSNENLVKLVKKLTSADHLIDRFQLVQRLMQLENLPEVLEALTASARQSARNADPHNSEINLKAVDSLRRRIQSNVSPKTALEAFAVEVAC